MSCLIVSGCYYLCDNGYAYNNVFLTPYKGVRYHLRVYLVFLIGQARGFYLNITGVWFVIN